MTREKAMERLRSHKAHVQAMSIAIGNGEPAEWLGDYILDDLAQAWDAVFEAKGAFMRELCK